MSGRFTVRRADDVRDQLTSEWLEFADTPGHRVHPKVVFEGDRAVAIGSMARNILHPEPRYFRFLMVEDADPDSLTCLFNELLADLGSDGHRAIHFSEPQRNERAAAWAESAGFLPIMRTWMGTVIPEGRRLEPTQRFRRLSDSDTPALRYSLAVLHSRIYRDQHSWNPPAAMLPEMAESLFLDQSELVPEYLWYSVDEFNRPTGVVSLRKTRAHQVLEFGWFGVLKGVSDSTHRGLFDTAMAAVGDRALNFEVDANEELTRGYFSELPVVWRDVLVRYERMAPD